MLIEEAGQVLEAHVLGSLVPSVEHLIMIGDPLQLRPTLNNFCEYCISGVHQGPYGFPALSMDNRRGRELYRFDMSLMERLSTSGLAMSQIDVQRRMRPTISDLIRYVKLSRDIACRHCIYLILRQENSLSKFAGSRPCQAVSTRPRICEECVLPFPQSPRKWRSGRFRKQVQYL